MGIQGLTEYVLAERADRLYEKRKVCNNQETERQPSALLRSASQANSRGKKKLGWRLTPSGESGLSFGMYGAEYAAGRRLEVENWTYRSTANSEGRHSRNSRIASHTAVTDSS